MESLGLLPAILEALSKLKFEAFTEPQRLAVPRIFAGRNALVIAPTGIGKTEAAMLPILHRILTEKPEPVSCLYITPLRALNRDMLRRMTFFGEQLGIRVAVRHGDTAPKERAAQTRPPPDEVASFLGGVGREVEGIKAPIPKGIRIAVEVPLPSDEDKAMAERLHLQEVQAAAIRRGHELIESHRSTLFFVHTRG